MVPLRVSSTESGRWLSAWWPAHWPVPAPPPLTDDDGDAEWTRQICLAAILLLLLCTLMAARLPVAQRRYGLVWWVVGGAALAIGGWAALVYDLHQRRQRHLTHWQARLTLVLPPPPSPPPLCDAVAAAGQQQHESPRVPLLTTEQPASDPVAAAAADTTTSRGDADAAISRGDADAGNAAAQTLWGYTCADGREGLALKLRLVQAAHHTVVLSLNYGGGRVLRQFLQVLRERLTAGVRALVCSSELFFQPLDRLLVRQLVRDFPHTLWWQRADLTAQASAHGRAHVDLVSNHLKLLVVDGGVAWLTGGTGVQDEYVQSDPWETVATARGGSSLLCRGYRDMDWCFGSSDGRRAPVGERAHSAVVRLAARWSALLQQRELPAAFTGEAGAQYEWSPLRRVSGRGGESTPTPTTTHPLLRSGADWVTDLLGGRPAVPVADCRWLFITPGPELPPSSAMAAEPLSADWSTELCRVLSVAQSHVWVAHLYLHCDPPLLAALEAAVRRGVDLTFVTNGWVRDSPLTHAVFVPRSRACVHQLLRVAAEAANRGGGRVAVHEYEVPHSTYHKKVMVVDERHVVLGNSNWGDKSLRLHVDDECNLVVDSPELARQTIATLRTDLTYCRPLQPALGRPLWRRAVEGALTTTHRHVLGAWIG